VIHAIAVKNINTKQKPAIASVETGLPEKVFLLCHNNKNKPYGTKLFCC
jgi:hypothetical protein